MRKSLKDEKVHSTLYTTQNGELGPVQLLTLLLYWYLHTFVHFILTLNQMSKCYFWWLIALLLIYCRLDPAPKGFLHLNMAD